MAAALPALGVVALSQLPAHAATGCSATYTKNDWGSGFTANITIKNLGDALSNWTLTYAYSGNQTLTSGWSGTWSQSGKNITVTNASWNGALAANASTTIGAQFTYSGTNTDPTSFAVNGTTCTGSVTTSPTPTTSPTTTPTGGTGTVPKLHVSGNKLVDASGKTVVLRGVNRSGGEFMCIQGYGIWDGAVDDTATAAIASWNAKAVRVPLNEDCWLGQSWVNSAYAGANYQAAVKAYVATLEAHGLVPILEPHWTYGLWTGNDSHCSTAHAECQKPMPDSQYTPTFWSQVANTFKGDTSVMFDLFNEPYPNNIGTMDYAQSWACWRDGGSACTGLTYDAAGMQSLVNAIRGTGAQNVIIAGGNSYSNDLSQWPTYKPADPTGNLAASWHSYNFNYCASSSCWDSQIAPVAASVPLLALEIGENDCGHSYIDTLMTWLDAHGASYDAWTWNTWDCSSGPSLISNLDGTPTAYGAGYKAHLASS
jgi:hypothetical protein